MEKENRIYESRSLVIPSMSLQSTQTLEDKSDAKDNLEAEIVFKYLSEELISEIIERIKSL